MNATFTHTSIGPSTRSTLHSRGGFDRHPLTDVRRDGDMWTARTGTLHLRWSGAGHAGRRRSDRDPVWCWS